MARSKPRYPTRAELEAGAEPVEAVPHSRLLALMTGRIGHRLDRWAVRHTGFSFISWQAARARGIPYQPSLLLITAGRKSGKPRPLVLPYVEGAGRFLVVASNAGRAKPPAWVRNLAADPRCTIVVDRLARRAHGHVAEGEDRELAMAAVAARRPHVYNYEYHARRNGRRLDIVILSPDDAEAS